VTPKRRIALENSDSPLTNILWKSRGDEFAISGRDYGDIEPIRCRKW
jgi:hypothetical protein